MPTLIEALSTMPMAAGFFVGTVFTLVLSLICIEFR
jgi:hypothetical protein